MSVGSVMNCGRRCIQEKAPALSLLRALGCLMLFSLTAHSLAQDIPDPNPRPNPDGTFTWWVGNNMQFDEIQFVLDTAFPGDEIVIMAGLYVEDLEIVTSDFTIRPPCLLDEKNQLPYWGQTVFWNPTEGPETDPWCIKVNGTINSYIGRPRQFKQLANGYQSAYMVQPGEWIMPPIAPAASVQEVTANSDGVAFTFWTRTTDSTAVYCVSGTPTFQACRFTSQKGFGGCVLAAGTNNAPAFIDCIFESTYAQGDPLDGYGVFCISIDEPEGGSTSVAFRSCIVRQCEGANGGVVNQAGGRSSWYDCTIEENIAPLGDGTVEIVGGSADFFECNFEKNNSRFGTIWIDGNTGPTPADPVRFIRCDFLDNTTIDTLWGGVLAATGVEGAPPPLELSGCGINGNNGNVGFSFYDIDTPFFPYYRIGADLVNASVLQSTITADLNNDGKINAQDLAILLGQWRP